MKVGPGKGLSNTQTRNSSAVVCQSEGEAARGPRLTVPHGMQQPGRKLSNTQTRNSLTCKR